jgi:acetyl esterase/lipase
VTPSNRFLVTALANSVTTANAVRPLDRVGPGSVPSFMAGVVPSELPLHLLAYQGVSSLVAARGGGARGLRGAVGLGLAAASAAGLWHLHRQAGRSAGVLDAALTDELGPDYRKRITEPFSPRPGVPVTRRRVLPTNWRARRSYRATRDLPYGEYGRRNWLDVWRRADLPADAGAPVLIQVHGGAWTVGRKEDQGQPLMAHLAERGWVCVAINYRLSPRATWPDQIVDVKRAIAWTKASVAEHGGDPDFVVLSGGSAGGHLTALAALTPTVPDMQPGFEEADTRVAAAVPFYGVYDLVGREDAFGRRLGWFVAAQLFKSQLDGDRARWEQASPLSQVGPGAPPFFVIHGANDSLVPAEQARAFAAALRGTSQQPVVYAELPGAQHAFDLLPSVRVHHTVLAVERFLAVVRSEHGGPTPAEAVVSDRT